MAEYKGQTDETHRIQLPSAIEQVLWTRPMAAPGGTVGLEVFTRYVGHGAEMQITLTDHRGRTHGPFRDQLYGNRLTAEIQVPESAREALYAEVKLPKHGLKQTSPALLLTPPVEIINARWNQDEARRGDVLTLSADVKGVPDGTEARIQIFEHDADGAHDSITRMSTLVDQQKVEAEWEYAYHEDTDDIPTEEESEKGYHPPEYFFRVEVHGLTAESGLLEFKDSIEIKLVNVFGQPVPNQAYLLYGPDGEQREGELDDRGRAEESDVPPGPYRVEFPDID